MDIVFLCCFFPIRKLSLALHCWGMTSVPLCFLSKGCWEVLLTHCPFLLWPVGTLSHYFHGMSARGFANNQTCLFICGSLKCACVALFVVSPERKQGPIHHAALDPSLSQTLWLVLWSNSPRIPNYLSAKRMSLLGEHEWKQTGQCADGESAPDGIPNQLGHDSATAIMHLAECDEE